MANATLASAPDAILSSIKSLSDAAYQQAKAGDTTESIARYVMSKEPNYPDSISDEGDAALTQGYRLRYHELRGKEVYYKVSESLYVPEADFKGDATKAKKVEVTVNYALAFTTHEFGRMADSHGAQFKSIIEKVRKDASTYVSNRKGDLKRAVNRIKNAGKTRTRAATKAFAERVDAMLKDLQKFCINAHTKGDPDADKAKLNKAIAAFNVVWKA